MSPPRTVGLLGGSFNPPHVAHQLLALYVLETQQIDELWLAPTFQHALGKPLLAYDHRVAMCELACTALGPRARVSRCEHELAHQPGFVASRTLDLIEYLAQTHPGVRFRLVIGADILGETAKWHRWDDVVAKAPPIVVGRAGYPLPAGATAAGLALPAVSSTEIRTLLGQLAANERAQFAAGGTLDPALEAVGALLPAQVLRYIATHGLYR